MYLPSAKKSKSPFHQVFGVFALEVNKIMQATPSKLRREMGMCATTIYVQQQPWYDTLRVLVVRSPVSSLSFQVQHTWYLVRYMQAPNRLYKSEVRGSVSRVKLLVSRDCLIARACYKQSNPFLMRRRRTRSAVSPMERGPTAKHHPAWKSQCTQWFRAEKFPLLCPTPKVMPCSSLGDAGEARWPLSNRWIDTSPILPDAAHDSRNQGRVVSLSVLLSLIHI